MAVDAGHELANDRARVLVISDCNFGTQEEPYLQSADINTQIL